jgi:uncharacterized protein (TIGR03503 family)
MFTRKNISALLFGLLLLPSWSAPAGAIGTAENDVRILIDVSGSMKHNDPQNLRRPALRLLTGLLNEHNHAGIWTFGRYVNMLVPPGKADSAWKVRARKASSKINSYGLFTNIEDALRDATWDWMSPDDRRQRSLILLTDGLVDVADDEQLDRASRARILDEILPGLQNAGIRIHTIALSTQADNALLKQISRATQGSYTHPTTAAELERVFLHLFEASTQADSLPLEGNTVDVDTSIREMTLLVFHDADAHPTRIKQPNGKIITAATSAEPVKWHSEQNYDLITIQHPHEGTWAIDARMDPDNRVVVVTDLRLETGPLPATLTVDDRRQIDIRLSERGQPLINKDLLHFIKVTATQYDAHGQQEQQWSLLDNGLRHDRSANDGIYTLSLEPPLADGRHELVIDVDGTTFSRQQRLGFEAFSSPVITAIGTTTRGATLHISPIEGLIDADSLQITAIVDGEPQPQQVARSHRNEWVLPLYGYDLAQPHQVTLSLSGSRHDRPVNMRLDPIPFGRNESKEKPAPTEADVSAATGERDKRTPPLKPVAIDHEEAAAPASPLTIMVDVLVMNLLGAGILFMLYRKYKPRLYNTHKLEELTHE